MLLLQLGNPSDEDLMSWAHHPDLAQIEDEVMRDIGGDIGEREGVVRGRGGGIGEREGLVRGREGEHW